MLDLHRLPLLDTALEGRLCSGEVTRFDASFRPLTVSPSSVRDLLALPGPHFLALVKPSPDTLTQVQGYFPILRSSARTDGISWNVRVLSPFRHADSHPFNLVFDSAACVAILPHGDDDFFELVVKSLSSGGGLDLRRRPEAIASAFLLQVSRQLRQQVKSVDAEIDVMDSMVLEFSALEERDFLTRLSVCRGVLMELQGALVAHAGLLALLSSPYSSDWFDANIRHQLKGIQRSDEVALLQLDEAHEAASSLGRFYLGRVNMEVNRSTTTASLIQRGFNAVAVIMLPTLFVQGLFSMNIGVPGKGVDNLWWWLAVNLSCFVAAAVGFAILRWIRYV